MPRGRPKSTVNKEQLEGLMAIGCTVEEAAEILAVSKDTLERNFAAVIKKGRARLKMSLRRMQYKTAQSGNVTMQIWMGKQYLEQRDKQELTGKDGGPLRTQSLRAEDLSDDELAAIISETDDDKTRSGRRTSEEKGSKK